MAHRWTKAQKAKLSATQKRLHRERLLQKAADEGRAAEERGKKMTARFERKPKRKKVTKIVQVMKREHQLERDQLNRDLLVHLTAELLRSLPDDKLVEQVTGKWT